MRWGFSSSCPSRIVLSTVLMDSDFVLLNDDSPTFLSSSYQSSSALDLTIASSSLAMRLSWRVGADSCGSDHFPVFVCSSLRPETSLPPKHSTRLYSVRTDWKAFQNLVNVAVRSFPSSILNVEVMYNTFVSVMSGALKSATLGKTSSRGLRPTVSCSLCLWWSPECDKLLQLRQSALAKFRCTSRFDDFLAYRR